MSDSGADQECDVAGGANVGLVSLLTLAFFWLVLVSLALVWLARLSLAGQSEAGDRTDVSACLLVLAFLLCFLLDLGWLTWLTLAGCSDSVSGDSATFLSRLASL